MKNNYPTLKELNCEVNKIDIEELFAKYEEFHFFYEEKRIQFNEHLGLIRENWQKAKTLADNLFDIITYQNEANNAWATICVWKNSLHGLMMQHLVSSGDMQALKNVLLATHARSIHTAADKSYQYFLLSNNLWANLLFGTQEMQMGHENTIRVNANYFTIYPDNLPTSIAKIKIVEAKNKDKKTIYDFAKQAVGDIYAQAEDLHAKDLFLDELNENFAKVGLFRKRFFKLAYLPSQDQPVGLAMAYRGPLGLNVSLLENRCDLIIDPTLNEEDFIEVACALIKSIQDIYNDFELDYLPIMANDRLARLLILRGQMMIRQYKHCMWLEKGFEDWFKHVEDVFSPRRLAGGENF
jgi:hypothetical protein